MSTTFPTSNVVRVITGRTMTEDDFHGCGDCSAGQHFMEAGRCRCCFTSDPTVKVGTFIPFSRP
jgi:hypothetical protein